jgi:hypothetical protein
MIGNKQNKVPFNFLLFGTKKFNINLWELEANKNTQEIFFWDPDLMYDWTNQVYLNKKVGQLVKTIKIRKAKGIDIDYRHQVAPNAPFFY